MRGEGGREGGDLHNVISNVSPACIIHVHTCTCTGSVSDHYIILKLVTSALVNWSHKLLELQAYTHCLNFTTGFPFSFQLHHHLHVVTYGCILAVLAVAFIPRLLTCLYDLHVYMCKAHFVTKMLC